VGATTATAVVVDPGRLAAVVRGAVAAGAVAGVGAAVVAVVVGAAAVVGAGSRDAVEPELLQPATSAAITASPKSRRTARRYVPAD
jgi:hypothetical protein